MTANPARVGFAPTRVVLPNGLTIVHQENAASPSITIRLRVAAGAALEDADTNGLAGFCGAMLKRGTERRSKVEIGELLDFTGGLLSASAGRHAAGIGAKARAADFDAMLELVAECAASPTFPVPEVEKLRGDILTAIREEHDDTGRMAMKLLRAAIYAADHPYSRPVIGTEETIAGIERDQLAAFHARHYGPGGALLVVVGAVGADQVMEVAGRTLGAWTSPTGAQGPDGGGLPAALPKIADAPGPDTRLRVAEVMAAKSQSDVAIGHPGLRRLDDDYFAAAVMNMILGSFAMGGRLGRSIREEKGMAYYTYSALHAGVGPGPFVVRAGVHPQNVEVAVNCVFEELQRIRREPVSDEELADAKSAIVRSLPRTLETNEGVAGALLMIEQYALGLDYLDRFPGLIEAVGRDDVLAVAQRRLQPDRCAVAVAGPDVGASDDGAT